MSGTSQLFKDMGPAKLGAIALVGLAILSSIIFMSMQLSVPAVVPLFSGLDGDDSSKIAAKLESMGVYYEMRSGGAQIMVPNDRVLNIRMNLAKDGLPTGRANIGYEIFDKSEGMGASRFVNNVNLLRALEGELGRTVSAFEHIESARVHLVIPKKDLFSKRKQEPTASVVLKVKGNQPIDKAQIAAISHLVATAVPDLNVKRITIVDTQGRPFKKGAENEDDAGYIAATNEEFKMQFQNRMKNVIEDLLSRSVGVGRVEVQVSATMNFDKIVTESETYDPEGQVARSVQTVEERENAQDGAVGGDVSAANNLPDGEGGVSNSGSKSNVERVDEVTNFEISKTIKKQVYETGGLKKLSIAVLVDGTYEIDEEAEEITYIERSEDELKKLEKLVKSAVGYDEERGDTVEIINMRFSTDIQGAVKEDKFAWLTRDLGNIIQTLVIGIVITLVVLLVVKPMVGRAFEITKTESDEAELKAALAGEDLDELAEMTGQSASPKKKESLIDIEKFEEKMNSTSVNAINDIIERHPDEAVTIIRGWLEADSA